MPASQKNPKDCEVCIKVLQQVSELAGKDIGNQEVVEAKLMQFCKNAVGKEHRFCWYIGALPSSATYIIKEVTGPLSRHLPVEVACQRVKKKDHSVCLLEYSSTDSNEGEGVEAAPEKPMDVSSLKDLDKKKVKELKQILSKKFSDPCKGCVEKSDFINRIRKLAKPGEL